MESAKKRVTTYLPNSTVLKMDEAILLHRFSSRIVRSRKAWRVCRSTRATVCGTASRADLGGSSDNFRMKHRRGEGLFLRNVSRDGKEGCGCPKPEPVSIQALMNGDRRAVHCGLRLCSSCRLLWSVFVGSVMQRATVFRHNILFGIAQCTARTVKMHRA